MKCQHCGSTDIILIQGQNYCLNCGYAVTPTQPTAFVAKTVARQHSERRQAASLEPSNRHLQDLKQVHPMRFSLVLALGAALASAAVAAGSLWFRLDNDIAAYLLAAVGVVAVLLVSLGHLALLYGSSRSQDGRPAPHDYWWMAARGGYLEVANVQLMALIEAVVIVGVGAVAWKVVAAASFGLYLSIGILGIINLILVWLLLGVYGAARLATPAVVLGGMNAVEASQVGWRLYRQAGGHIIGVGLEALVARLVMVAVWGGALYAVLTRLDTGNQPTLIGVLAVGLALVVFCFSLLVLRLDTSLWLRHYRRLALASPASERLRLLTGRLHTHVKP